MAGLAKPAKMKSGTKKGVEVWYKGRDCPAIMRGIIEDNSYYCQPWK